MISFSDSRKRR